METAKISKELATLITEESPILACHLFKRTLTLDPTQVVEWAKENLNENEYRAFYVGSDLVIAATTDDMTLIRMKYS